MRTTNNLLWLTALLLLVPAGCMHTEKTSSAPPPHEAAAPKLIMEGSCLELKDRPVNTASMDSFTCRVAELLNQNKAFSAAQLVERYPDLANAALAGSSGPSALTFIQQVHTRQLSRSDIYSDVAKLLQQGEQHRKSQEKSAWIASWEGAVLVAAAAPVPDPNLWEKISSLQPADLSWPDALAGSFQNYWIRRGLGHIARTCDTSQDLVWFSIGHWHLDRGEAKAAFAAFKRAVNTDSAGPWKEMVDLYEAKAMMQLKQSPAAISILTRLATHNDSPWKRPALAAIGACKFQGGHFQQAEALYKKALENLSHGPHGEVEDFVGKSEAESDLGLVLLALGDEAKGLALLHANRETFARTGQVDALLQDLENEIRYFEVRQRAGVARQLRTDL